jgi:hypothetical protein
MTGKLSDFAGLFFFPILLVTIARPGRTVRPAAKVASLLTGIVFATVKLVPAANDFVARHWGAMTLDPSDLMALPACVASWLWMVRESERQPTRPSAPHLDFLGVVMAAIASLATSTEIPLMPPPPLYGQDCALIQPASCSVTGSFDARLTVAATNKGDDPCDVTIVSVREGVYAVQSETRFESPPHVLLAPRAREFLTFNASRATAFVEPVGSTFFQLRLEEHHGTSSSASAPPLVFPCARGESAP